MLGTSSPRPPPPLASLLPSVALNHNKRYVMSSGLIPEFALLVTNLYAPAGTSIPMAQAAAPLGWTSSTVSDTSFRYNSSTGGSSAGTVAWSSWNSGGTFNLNAFTLTVAQLPSHNHGVNDPGHTHTDSGHVHQVFYGGT